MKASRILLAALTLSTGLACGGGASPSSVVFVTVTAAPDMAPVSQLRVTITNLSDASVPRTETELFPEKSSPTPLKFDASFALAFPKSRTGALNLVVEALGSGGDVVAVGSGQVAIVIGGRANVTVHLGTPGDTDAGTDGAGGNEAGRPPDDSAPLDGTQAFDTTAPDGQPGQEVSGYDGTGGGGVDGHSGTGGVGSGGAGAGGSPLDGAAGSETGRDVNDTGGSGGISSTGGAGGNSSTGGAGGYDGGIDGGMGGISSTGGTGGISTSDAGDAGGAGDADAADAPPATCSTTVACPTYPNCRIQPACDTTTGLCSAPSQCSVCGNGLVEFSEECDDGNTISGDHCNSACKWEYCGDGVVQSMTLASLSLIYLARSCDVFVEQDIWMVLNGQEVARGIVRQTCDCAPGIVTIPVTNPAFLQLGNNGTNVVEAHTHAEISWAVVHWESPSGSGDTWPIDVGGNGAAQYRRPDLCVNGSVMGMESGVQVTFAGGEQCDHGAKNGTAGDTCNANCTVN